jgi:S1-C subfamily serine protease
VQEVVPDGPADKAGIRGGVSTSPTEIAAGGDLIVELDGRRINSPDDVATAIADNKPGDRITAKFLRDRKERQVQITLGKRPAQVPGQDPGGGGGILPQP